MNVSALHKFAILESISANHRLRYLPVYSRRGTNGTARPVQSSNRPIPHTTIGLNHVESSYPGLAGNAKRSTMLTGASLAKVLLWGDDPLSTPREGRSHLLHRVLHTSAHPLVHPLPPPTSPILRSLYYRQHPFTYKPTGTKSCASEDSIR